MAGAICVFAMERLLRMRSSNGRASLVPAAAVIPAPVEYTGVAAVEEPVARISAPGERVLFAGALSGTSERGYKRCEAAECSGER